MPFKRDKNGIETNIWIRKAKSKALERKKGKGFMHEIAEKAEKSDKERTGQSGKYFEKRFDNILNKKK